MSVELSCATNLDDHFYLFFTMSDNFHMPHSDLIHFYMRLLVSAALKSAKIGG